MKTALVKHHFLCLAILGIHFTSCRPTCTTDYDLKNIITIWATYSSVFTAGVVTPMIKINHVFPLPYHLTSLISLTTPAFLMFLVWFVFLTFFYSFHSVHCDVTAVAHACAFVWRLPWKIVPHENWVWCLYFRVCTKILFSCCIGWMERVDSAAVIRFEGNCLWYFQCFWFSEICCIFLLCYANRAVKL
jgi:hypothetical protein